MRKTQLPQMLNVTREAAARCFPTKKVDYTRLDRLFDAWNAFKNDGCEGEKNCGCKRCVTMDILTMTHIIEFEDFEEQLNKLVTYIGKVCEAKPWALASLMPGKSNYWLTGWLLDKLTRVSGSGAAMPSCFYLTSVNDTKVWESYSWTEYRAEDAAEPDHVFVLDDVSYSGTQFANLIRQVSANAPTQAHVHACPLFCTPHAARVLGGVRHPRTTYWADCALLLDNESLFNTLGVHRESKAENFRALMDLYSRSWNDASWKEYNKTLTTYVPFYKIPDYFSCPVKAYVTPRIEPAETLKYTEILRYTFTIADQNPKYKEARDVRLS